MKTKSAQPPKHKKLRIVTLLLVVLLVCGGVFLYKQQQKNQAITKERAEYAQAEKDLDSLKSQIIAKFGQPDDQKEVNYCAYTSTDFGKGALYCNTNEYLLYGVNDITEAQEIASQSVATKSLSTNYIHGDGQPVIGSLSYKLENLDCLSDYSYHISTENLNGLGYTSLDFKNSKQALLIELSCSAKHPKAAYYPIENSNRY